MTIKRTTISRRRALGVATAGAGLPVLAACGDDEGGSTAADPGSSSGSPSDASSPSPTKPDRATKVPVDGIPTADVPVGGGVVVPDDKVVITQPTDGEFMAFSAVCTHQGCVVARVTSEIECDCHGSRFSITSGEATSGPASAPLGAARISVRGDRITVR